jgi:hypothetical protein
MILQSGLKTRKATKNEEKQHSFGKVVSGPARGWGYSSPSFQPLATLSFSFWLQKPSQEQP